MIKRFSEMNRFTIRKFAGYGWVGMKNFERIKFLAIGANNGNFEVHMSLSEDRKVAFEWWEKNMKKALCSIRQFRAVTKMFSNASRSGWRAYCTGKCTHGHWSQDEQALHIHYLELLSAFFALRCFAKNLKNCDV